MLHFTVSKSNILKEQSTFTLSTSSVSIHLRPMDGRSPMEASVLETQIWSVISK